MTIGLLAGCMQDDKPPKDNEQPMDEEIQDDIDNMEEETDDMFDEGDVNQDEMEPGTDDQNNIGDTNDDEAPEESEGGDRTEEQKET